MPPPPPPPLVCRVTLYPVGLGPQNDTCFLVAGDGNVGDGFTTCGVQTAAEAESKHAVRGGGGLLGARWGVPAHQPAAS
jgi:hypothetical protein